MDRNAKITASERLAGNESWQTEQRNAEIIRLRAILRDDRLTRDERAITDTMLKFWTDKTDEEK